ncbi:carboxypeptidase-like regulatory domain-containing protein [Aureivirga marina]|uniref:carboxypeptidase-like regulatory domain-containing protein n=1 Tax=Aureivirga marina TaxID=1182451 RepID=UPI0018C9E034|nr:carboxypeptidase-like regulatory domain-containing protein [Aureivirga marina]
MKKNRIVKIAYFFLLFLFSIINLYSQEISGTIKDSIGVPISYANILLKKSDNIENYTYSDEHGNYALQVKDTGNYQLHFSSMSYAKKIVPIQIIDLSKNIERNIILHYEAMQLDEVIVQAERDIIIGKNKVTFNVKKFLSGNEEVAEDVLKKLPGVDVDSDGIVKVNGKEIEKLMVEGDDFFEKGYTILSKSLPSEPIEKVEILEKYTENELLQNVENSNKVAINLKLKENAKRQWFGNIDFGIGASDQFRYDSQFNLMNFGKKNKYYFLGNTNNIGKNATGPIQHLIRPFRLNKIDKIGEDVYAKKLIDISMESLGFKNDRSNFNNTELLSLNAIFNPSSKTKIKILGFFNWDENDFYKNSFIEYNLPDFSFSNSEDFHLRKKKKIAFGKLEIKHRISEKELIEFISSFNKGDFQTKKDLIFNSTDLIEKINTENELFNQEITYTNKFKERDIFILKSRFIYENSPQNYWINQFLYEDLFSIENANNVLQNSQNKVTYFGLEAHLLSKNLKGNLFEIITGNQFKKDNLNSIFSIKENDFVIEKPFNFQNEISYFTNDSYLKGKYSFKLTSKFQITGKIGLHQLLNRLKNFDVTKDQQLFFINPNFHLQWEFLEKHKLSGSVSVNTTNATILNVYENYILTSFRNFKKGTNQFNQLQKIKYNLIYTYGNWSENFTAFAFLSYLKSHDYFSSRSQIEQNYTLSEQIYLNKNRDFFIVNTQVDRYLNFINSRIKLKLNYFKTSYFNEVNNSELRKVVSSNYDYGIELRSGFKGVFNYNLGTKWKKFEVKSNTLNKFTNTISFLDLEFNLSEKLFFSIQNERYLFGNLDKKNNTYYFSDFSATYVVKKNKISFELSGQNLTNTKVYKTYFADDNSISSTEYRLLPRFLLCKIKYRF